MKTRLSKIAFFAFLTALMTGIPVAGKTAGPAQDPKIEVVVRATVEQPFKGFRKAKLKEHGKVYLLASLELAPSDIALIQRVDKPVLLQNLHDALRQRGYQEASVEAPPEIVLTVVYGRGMLRNPYTSNMLDIAPMSEPGLANLPLTTYSGGLPIQLANSREFNFEGKLQRASQEKLFIRIDAWAPPGETAATVRPKPQRLWSTTMYVDNPHAVDLNEVSKVMLAAGSPWFDRKMEKPEMVLAVALQEGHVELGPLVFP